jgi:hypothetical protein
MTSTYAHRRHHSNLHEEPMMFYPDRPPGHADARLEEFRERRQLERHLRAGSDAYLDSSLRRKFGRSLIRLGQRVAGEPGGSPALTG